MTAALDDRTGRAAGFRSKTFQAGGRAGDRFLDAQGFGAQLVVVFGVGNGRVQRLGDETRTLARHNGEHGFRLQGGQPLDLPDDFAHFLRGHRNIFGDCENFHKYYLASALAVWAPCFLNVRVSENSPSLWPTMFSVTNTGLKILPL